MRKHICTVHFRLNGMVINGCIHQSLKSNILTLSFSMRASEFSTLNIPSGIVFIFGIVLTPKINITDDGKSTNVP